MSTSKKKPPKHVVIGHDDYHAEYVGKTKDGRQFFLTVPFVPPTPENKTGCEFIALYVFDKKGLLLEATIDDLGPRATLDHEARIQRRDELLRSLGSIRYCNIKVAPFHVERFGLVFGCIAIAPEEPGEDWCVIVEPGNVMCFYPPWTSGEYDT